jgi:hypothetical protein
MQKTETREQFLGSWFAMNGVPDKGRMQLMGHKTTEMTARYTLVSVSSVRVPGSTQPASVREVGFGVTANFTASGNAQCGKFR